ncbi:MAG: NAD-binding protein [Rhizobiaceae bacterium]
MKDWLRRYWLFVAFAVILMLGATGFLIADEAMACEGGPLLHCLTLEQTVNAFYNALRLFVLDFNAADYTLNPFLQIARFSAALFSALAALTLAVPRAAQWFAIQTQKLRRGRRAVVLGYGPLGQAVARELHSKRRGPFLVTAIHRGVTPDLRDVARRDKVLLVEGNPASLSTFRQVDLDRCVKIVAALGDDMRTLDAAEAARGHVGRNGPSVTAFLNDPDLATGFADSAPRGFLGGPGIRGFCLATEAAQALIASARFDRIALEAGQARVHLVVIGCGAQGEAVAVETLLTAWRRGLGPPRITLLDRDIGAAEARFRRRSPALFAGEDEPGRLPATARPDIAFDALDLEKTDFGSDETIARHCSEGAGVTVWVFATGDDSLNLRGALALHTAMLRRRRAAAPIYVRIWSGHAGDTPVLSTPGVGMAHTFGSLEDAMAATAACDADPDAVPRALHAQYVATGEQMRREASDFRFTDAAWNELDETKRTANRRLHRHTAMKLEDLGAQWRRGERGIPVVDDALRERFIGIEHRFDYARIVRGPLPDLWWKGDDGFRPTDEERMRAERIASVAIAEHDRWTIDRALEGWRPTFADGARRDEERRLHPNMHGWDRLDPMTKRWDAVLLRALVDGGGHDRNRVSAWPAQSSRLTLALGAGSERTPPEPRWVGREPALSHGLVTQIDLAILGSVEPRWAASLRATATRLAKALLSEPRVAERLCRIRFLFHEPPSEGVIAIANAIATEAFRKGIEVSSSWLWGTATPAPLGFIGHRDLSRVGGPDGLAEVLDRLFAAIVAEGRAVGLVTGYAPGADRLAVERWLGLGLPKPTLVFPYRDNATGDWLSDRGSVASPDERVTGDSLRPIGSVRLAATNGKADAHSAQALDVIRSCGILVAIHDGQGSSGKGSVGDTIARARKAGRPVVTVTRDKNGAWRTETE